MFENMKMFNHNSTDHQLQSTLTNCKERLVAVSWEPPPVSLCVRLSAEEEGFREQRGHHHSGILLLGSLYSSLGTRLMMTNSHQAGTLKLKSEPYFTAWFPAFLDKSSRKKSL